jgi:thiamine-phosphate pyrophosphorylase
MSALFLNALAGTRLYPLTDCALSGLSHSEQISRLVEGGVRIVQIREKFLSSLEFYQQAAEAVRSVSGRSVKIIINDRVDIALAVKADGVHLGQDDLPPQAARELLGADAIIGLSTHNLEQVQLATQLPLDYIALGPIFSTTTKQAPEPNIGLDGLARIRKAVGTLPMVAIGGITADNSKQVLEAGADAVAVIGDIWNSSGGVKGRIERLLHRAVEA